MNCIKIESRYLDRIHDTYRDTFCLNKSCDIRLSLRSLHRGGGMWVAYDYSKRTSLLGEGLVEVKVVCMRF